MNKKELAKYLTDVMLHNINDDNLDNGEEQSVFGIDEFQFTDRDGETHTVKVVVDEETPKLFELELAFKEKLDRAPIGEPMTLAELFEYGFNSLRYDGKNIGYCAEDFVQYYEGGELTLDTKVMVEYTDEDMDGFTIAIIGKNE